MTATIADILRDGRRLPPGGDRRGERADCASARRRARPRCCRPWGARAQAAPAGPGRGSSRRRSAATTRRSPTRSSTSWRRFSGDEPAERRPLANLPAAIAASLRSAGRCRFARSGTLCLFVALVAAGQLVQPADARGGGAPLVPRSLPWADERPRRSPLRRCRRVRPFPATVSVERPPPVVDPGAIPEPAAWPHLNPDANLRTAWLLAEGPAHPPGDAHRYVTFTFDDGPFPETTPTVLRVLAQHRAARHVLLSRPLPRWRRRSRRAHPRGGPSGARRRAPGRQPHRGPPAAHHRIARRGHRADRRRSPRHRARHRSPPGLLPPAVRAARRRGAGVHRAPGARADAVEHRGARHARRRRAAR